MTTTYVYDATGQLAAEYTPRGPRAWLRDLLLDGDHLGSTRAMVDQAGVVRSLHDYLPFGEEIPATVGGRSSSLYSPSTLTVTDGTTQKFTGKERDAETGLDYFGARYFSAAQGRFTTPDPFNPIDLAKSKDTADKFRNYISNPQHWNHYAIRLNNPLRYTDPLGLLEYDAELLHKKIHVHIDDNLVLKRQNELKAKLDSAIKNINEHENKLTGQQSNVLGEPEDHRRGFFRQAVLLDREQRSLHADAGLR